MQTIIRSCAIAVVLIALTGCSDSSKPKAQSSSASNSASAAPATATTPTTAAAPSSSAAPTTTLPSGQATAVCASLTKGQVTTVTGREMGAPQPRDEPNGPMTIRGCRWDLAQKSTNPGDDYSVIVTRVRPEDINSGSSLTPDQYFQQTRDSLPSTTPIDGLGDQAFSAGNAVYVLRNHEHLAVLVGLSIPDPVQAATDLARHVLDAE